jgi:lactoylglutathione lyase
MTHPTKSPGSSAWLPRATTPRGPRKDIRFDHVGLNVASLDEMRDWYAGALGLEVEYEFALEEFGFSGAMLLSPEGWRLELLHRVGNVAGIVVDRPMDAAMTRGFGHLALTVDDLEATYDRLLAAGAASRMPPSQSPEPGVRIAFVADPEGNLVELLDRS